MTSTSLKRTQMLHQQNRVIDAHIKKKKAHLILTHMEKTGFIKREMRGNEQFSTDF